MKDFTLKSYAHLLKTFADSDYVVLNFLQYCEKKSMGELPVKYIVLRHDVDELAANALKMAKLEYSMGITSTYFFRVVKQSNQPDIIRAVIALGHEVGYHYEDLSVTQGDMSKAYQLFQKHLNYFRTFYPVKTVCMHGSSYSKYDNRDLWKYNNLSDFGLIGEPYLTTDFNEVFYLSDTGYAWDGGQYAVRDVVENHFDLIFHSSNHIINALKENQFPNKCMVLTHTWWTESNTQWIYLHLREFCRNNVKRMAKKSKLIQWMYSKLVKSYWKL